MRRLSIVFLAFVFLFSGAQAVLAQDSLEEGVKAEKETAKAVIAAAKLEIKNLNENPEAAFAGMTPNFQEGVLRTQDPVAGVEAIKAQFLAPITVLKSRNVRQLSDGRFSVDFSLSGWFGPNWYLNQRWVFVPSGDTYLLDGVYDGSDPKYVPDDMSSIELNVVNAGGQVTLDQSEVDASDVVFFNLDNQDQAFLALGLFKLHEGVEPNGSLSLSDMDMVSALIAGPVSTDIVGFVDLEGTFVIVPVMPDGTQMVPTPGASQVPLIFNAS